MALHPLGFWPVYGCMVSPIQFRWLHLTLFICADFTYTVVAPVAVPNLPQLTHVCSRPLPAMALTEPRLRGKRSLSY